MIIVQINNEHVAYKLYKTSAPERYDGFGTFTVDTQDDGRYVLVEHKHAEWQVLNYRSGLYTAEDLTDDQILIEWAMGKLWIRMKGLYDYRA